MFEPKTYWELRAATDEALLNALIQHLPSETKTDLQPILSQYAMQMEALKARHVISLNIAPAAQPVIVDVLRAELIRVCAKATPPQTDDQGQLTKPGVGTGFVPEGLSRDSDEQREWVNSLPSYVDGYVTKRGAPETGFYNFGGEPILVIKTEAEGDVFLNLIRFDGFGVSVNTIIPTRGPIDFNWESPMAGDMHFSEFFDYIGHLDVDAFLAAWDSVATDRFLPITRTEYDIYFQAPAVEDDTPVANDDSAEVPAAEQDDLSDRPVLEEPGAADAPADVPAQGVSEPNAAAADEVK